MISSFYGPLPGSFNDLNILDYSRLNEIMERHCRNYYLYGDAAYISRGSKFMTAFTPPSSDQEKSINLLMNSYRTEVEHSFAVVSNNFSFPDFSRAQKINLTNIIMEYTVCILFCNIINCYSPNQRSQRFNMVPPSIRNYLHA